MQLRSISMRAKYQSKRERAMIVLASATGMPAPQIAELVGTDDSHVRKVIHAFNEEGFESLDPKYRGGRPKKTSPPSATASSRSPAPAPTPRASP